MKLEQVVYVMECNQSCIAILHFQQHSILRCGKVTYTEDTNMEQEATSFVSRFSNIWVSCHNSLFILAEVIGFKNKFIENLSLGIKVVDPKGKEPMALFGQLIIMESKNMFDDWIQEDDIWNDRLGKLEIFGDIDKLNGNFLFKKCQICNGPWIAHENIDDENVCKRIQKRDEKLSDVEVLGVESWIKEMPLYWARLAEIDTRKRACYCDSCAKTFPSRAKYENHLITKHRISTEKTTYKSDSKQDLTLLNILSNQNTMLEKLVNKSVETPKPSQLLKPKLPPVWIGQEFEVFDKEVSEWTENNLEDEYEKYGKIIESLKKNNDVKGLKEYMIDVFMPTAKEKPRAELTVKFLMGKLKVRFGKSKLEKLQGVLRTILNFSVNSSETDIEFVDRFSRLMIQIENEKVADHFKFLMSILMISKAHDGGLVTADQKTRLLDAIQTGNSMSTRKPVCETLIEQKLKDEFYKLKIETNSFNKQAQESLVAAKASSTYYENGRSRYDTWKSFKNSSDFSKFRTSDSRPGYWRSDSRYVREPSRSRSRPSFEARRSYQGTQDSRQRSMSRSQSRSDLGRSRPNKIFEEVENLKKSHESLEKKTDEVVKANKEIMKILEKIEKRSNTVRIVETVKDHEDEEIQVSSEVMNVMYAKDVKETDMMIVDTGCPKSLVGEFWIEKYLTENNLNKKHLNISKCRQYFRFGPGQIYESDEFIVLPVSFKASESQVLKNEIVYTTMEVYIVKNASVPLLCGRNTLSQWGAVLDIKQKIIILECKGGKKVSLEQTPQGHLVMKMFNVGEWSTEESVYFIKNEVDDVSIKQIKKIHENLAHKSEDQMLHAYRNAGKLTKKVREFIKIVISRCNVCKKYKKSFPRPKVTLPKVTDFNQVVTIDLKQFDNKYVLWCVCSFTRFIQGTVIPDKSAKTIIKALNETWNWRFGFPSVGFWADNGLEFQNSEMYEYASKFGFSIKFGPTYSPWSNGVNERNHASADVVVKKILEEDKNISLKTAVSLASWTHNTNVNVLGYDPMSLVTGKSVMYPGVTVGNLATDCAFSSENVQQIMERHKRVTEIFRQDEYSSKLKMAEKVRSRPYQNLKYQTGDTVFYQEKDNKVWLGPVKVQNQDGPNVWIYVNGDLKKVASCKVQPHFVHGLEEEESVVIDDSPSSDKEDEITVSEECIETPRVRTRSETRKLKDKENDIVGAFYLKAEGAECFDDEHTIYVVEVPVKEHCRSEVVDAKFKEVQNLKDYNTFEEVLDEGQDRVGSRWVVTKKEKHDGQKTQFKARLVAKGFHEKLKPQADSPTAMRESFKLFCSIASNENFSIQSMDIRAAFLQSKELDRDVFLEPPKDLKNPGMIWKLKKPLYGLDDASRKFWICVKEIFHTEGLQNITGDEAFYFQHQNGQLVGMILTHVDDFSMAGTSEFLSRITKSIKENLTVSKVETNNFRFTGIDVIKVEDTIVISMNDYADSIEYIEEFRPGKPDEKLSVIELKLFRKYTGKISWLAANTRPDLAVVALQMSMKGKDATLKDFRRINHIINWIKEKESKVVFSCIGHRNELRIIGIGDASYKMDSKSIGGSFVLLGNVNNQTFVPIYWKSKSIQKVCHSAKAAETRNLVTCKDDSLFFAGQVSQLLFGKLSEQVPVTIFTDSIPLLESIGSTKQIEEKMLRNSITDFKEDIAHQRIESFAWLATKDMLADILTKECRKNKLIDEVLLQNMFANVNNEDLRVVMGSGELRLVDKRKIGLDGSSRH